MDSRDIIGQTAWIACRVRKSRVRGDSYVPGLQEDGLVDG